MHLFGIYELDISGTVLYSRPYEDEITHADHTMIGHNFFDEIAPLENAELLRRQVRTFVNSGQSVSSFTFASSMQGVPIKAKILITRGRESSGDGNNALVIMDIRKLAI